MTCFRKFPARLQTVTSMVEMIREGMMGTRLFWVVVFIAVMVLLDGGTVNALEHQELDKILKSTPPNGPFWKYGTVIMRRNSRKAGMKPVVFAHWSHRANYTCRVCHLELGFSMRSGETGITREQYLSGKFCGACHDGKTAFTVKDGPQAGCAKCHMENPRLMEAALEKFAASMPQATFGNGIDWSKAL